MEFPFILYKVPSVINFLLYVKMGTGPTWSHFCQAKSLNLGLKTKLIAVSTSPRDGVSQELLFGLQKIMSCVSSLSPQEGKVTNRLRH